MIFMGQFIMSTTLISPSAVVKWHPEHVAAEVLGNTVVMSIVQGKYVGFDDIASAVWRHLKEPQPVVALSARLADEFDGDSDLILNDLINFLGEMLTLDLIVVDSIPASTKSDAVEA